MEIPDKMKLNKFEAVHIPSNCEFFSRFGKQNPLDTDFGGEETITPLQSKLDAIIEADKEYQRS